MRTNYALPLATAFMLFFLINNLAPKNEVVVSVRNLSSCQRHAGTSYPSHTIKAYKKKMAVVVACLALLSAAYQAQISAQLYYSDQMRYNEDVRLAYELDNLITQVQPKGKKLPVALAGLYHSGSRFHANFLEGEMLGNSVFRQGPSIYQSTDGGLAFMKSLGINFDMPNNSQLNQALREAASMPAYPDPGCVKRTRDFIVVRISETLY
jgi:hypothetical protein